MSAIVRSFRPAPALAQRYLTGLLLAYANRSETKHLPYAAGTLRAEPLRDALKRFKRPATVISESPDEESHQAVQTILRGSHSRKTRSPA